MKQLQLHLHSRSPGLKADGSVSLTGDWDAGPHEIRAEQFYADVTTGTPPLIVDSTTVVPNLNVDQVDGKDSTDLVLVDGTQALTANWDAGSFQIRAETFQSDVTTGTAPFTVASTTLVSNLNAERLNSLQSTAFVLVDGSQAFSADQSMGGNKLTNVGTPTASGDAATKSYVDSAVGGLDWKASVRAASTADVTLATDVENGDTFDGITLATGDRILLKDQSTATENGIYVVAASGAPSRASDLDTGDSAAGAVVLIEEGSSNADSAWLCTSNVGSDVVGTDNLAFTQFGVGATDHGSLNGLADDDHTQYAKADGTRWGAVQTADRAIQTDGSGHLEVSTVTSMELGYLSGVTSSIQTQLDGKAASSHNHAASDINSGTLAHERGGLEADVSAYSGLLKISGGSTSQATAGTDYLAPLLKLDLPLPRVKFPSSNPAVLDRSATADRLLFDDTTEETISWDALPATDYKGGTLKADIWYTAASATTNNVKFGVSVYAISDGDSADIDTASYDTENTAEVTVPGTAGHPDVATVTLTNKDSLAQNDWFAIKLARKTSGLSGTNATGDIEVRRIRIYEE